MPPRFQNFDLVVDVVPLQEILGPAMDLDDVVDLDGDGKDVNGDGEEVYGASEELNRHGKNVNRAGEEVNGSGQNNELLQPGEEKDTDDSKLSDWYTDSDYELEHDDFDENVADPDVVPEFEERRYESYCSDEVCNSDRLESLAGSETEEDDKGNPIKMLTRRVAEEVNDRFLVDEDWSRKGIHKHKKDTYNIDIPMQTITRGKRAAKEMIEGHYIKQYNKLAAYIKKLLRSNHGSTMGIMTEMDGLVRRFKRM
ncbi:hypothetical protein ACLB2K_049649 [Fragaria x ananassa]